MIRAVLVTGAGSGIGLATALHLAGLGFAVTGLVPTAGQEADLRAAARQRGVDLEAIEVDLADADRRAGVATSLDLWGLVNNAGYMNAGLLRDVPVEDARRQLETMVLAPLDLVRQALPAMTARGHGRIVNVTSSAVHTSTPLTGWYAACKAALRELTDSLRVELDGSGVDVVDLEPGGYRTGIWSGAVAELHRRRVASDRPDVYDRVLGRLDGARRIMGDPDRVAVAVGEILTMGRPPAHVRIGPGAASLRLADTLVPDRVWDRAVSLVSGIR